MSYSMSLFQYFSSIYFGPSWACTASQTAFGLCDQLAYYLSLNHTTDCLWWIMVKGLIARRSYGFCLLMALQTPSNFSKHLSKGDCSKMMSRTLYLMCTYTGYGRPTHWNFGSVNTQDFVVNGSGAQSDDEYRRNYCRLSWLCWLCMGAQKPKKCAIWRLKTEKTWDIFIPPKLHQRSLYSRIFGSTYIS